MLIKDVRLQLSPLVQSASDARTLSGRTRIGSLSDLRDTGVCEINTRSENTRCDSQPRFPQISMLTK